MKVKEAIELLKSFNQDSELVCRKSFDEGYYADYSPVITDKLFPSGDVHILIGEPIEALNTQAQEPEGK